MQLHTTQIKNCARQLAPEDAITALREVDRQITIAQNTAADKLVEIMKVLAWENQQAKSRKA